MPRPWLIEDFQSGGQWALIADAQNAGEYFYWDATLSSNSVADSLTEFRRLSDGAIANTLVSGNTMAPGIYYSAARIGWTINNDMPNVTWVSEDRIYFTTGSSVATVSAYTAPGLPAMPVMFAGFGDSTCGSTDALILSSGAIDLDGVLYAPVGNVAFSLYSSGGTFSGGIIGWSVAMAVSNHVLTLDETYFAPQPEGASINVTTTTDEVIDNSDCSLREAVIAANTNSNVHEDACAAGQDNGIDTITLANGTTYSLTIAGSDEDAAATGDLDITDNTIPIDLIIDVAGGGSATISQDASPDDRVLHVLSGAGVEIYGVTVTGGSNVLEGGGILNEGTLVLDAATLQGSTADVEFGGGGGLFNQGTATLQNGTLIGGNSGAGEGNSAAIGGGVANGVGATMTINSSIVAGNAANLTFSFGGGISNEGTLLIENGSVIGGDSTAGYGNTAISVGGGIFNTGDLIIDASMVSGNSVTDPGQGPGGLYTAGTAQILNGSVIGGDATAGLGNTAWICAGLLVEEGTLLIDASVIAGNSAVLLGGGMCNAENTVIQNGSVVGGSPGTGDANTAENGAGIYNTDGILTIDASLISGNSATAIGGGILNEPYETLDTLVIVTNSVLHMNDAVGDGDAVYNLNPVVDAVSVTASCIYSNGDVAIYNNVSEGQTATGNWWGSSDGPSGFGPGSGDSVSANVDFSGFLTTSECGVDLPTPTPEPTPSPTPEPTPSPTPPPPPPNLIENGDMEEDVDADSIPDFWSVSNKVTIPPDGQVCDLDGCSLLLTGDNGSKVVSQTLGIVGLAGDTYEFSASSMADSVPAQFSYEVVVTLDYDKGKDGNFVLEFTPGTHGWETLNMTIVAAKDYTDITVEIVFRKKSGMAWFDDIVLSESP